MITSGVCPTIQAELTNKIAAFTRIPPYRLTGARTSKAGRAHTRGRSVAQCLIHYTKTGTLPERPIQGALDCIASIGIFGIARHAALACSPVFLGYPGCR